ncbi:MAG: hypothetical protein GWM98_17905 [Nitrospinaceae bacterium]|nr:hypothetical protein [Nitrospinaceae bacterium]NIR56023.1 hypothetical protein [Nitrospinaceae bacterium]NIS86467.1 hypothetical protein [Nitrospinaceae bacterium]NIT83302.1 hypothetical protein [Nitrospinaceae bacterium]NIU45512.1 hypothetical protein [Nitrospinaceae bacterium]
MKKWLAFLIMTSFMIAGAGSAFAAEPDLDVLDRHAVWTKWFEEDGKRQLQLDNFTMKSEIDKEPRRISTENPQIGEMTRGAVDFDFVHETEYYDYEQDPNKRNYS